jgi:hypothetical protein
MSLLWFGWVEKKTFSEYYVLFIIKTICFCSFVCFFLSGITLTSDNFRLHVLNWQPAMNLRNLFYQNRGNVKSSCTFGLYENRGYAQSYCPCRHDQNLGKHQELLSNSINIKIENTLRAVAHLGFTKSKADQELLFISTLSNKNLDIKCIAHDAFLE